MLRALSARPAEGPTHAESPADTPPRQSARTQSPPRARPPPSPRSRRSPLRARALPIAAPAPSSDKGVPFRESRTLLTSPYPHSRPIAFGPDGGRNAQQPPP